MCVSLKAELECLFGVQKKIAHKFRYPIGGRRTFFAKITDFLHFDEMVGLGGGGWWGPKFTFRLFRIRHLFILYFNY